MLWKKQTSAMQTIFQYKKSKLGLEPSLKEISDHFDREIQPKTVF